MFPVAEIRRHYWDTLATLTSRVSKLEHFRYSTGAEHDIRAVNIIISTLGRYQRGHRTRRLGNIRLIKARKPPHRFTVEEARAAGRKGKGVKKRGFGWRLDAYKAMHRA